MKRKVTDLKPNEAILITNDADLKVLEEFYKLGKHWFGGQIPTMFNPKMAGARYPYVIVNSPTGLYWDQNIRTHYPATDFIVSEGEMERGITIVKQNGEVISAETVLLSDVRNKLTPIKNLIAMLESGFIAPSGSVELIYKEIKQSIVNIEELTRNTPTNEQR